MIIEILKKIYKDIRLMLRKKLILEKWRAINHNIDLSIISSDCTGGLLCHELGIRFNSPTINMFMMAEDYLSFCRNIEYWINQPWIEVETEYEYPVVMLGEKGIKLYLVHYKSVDEAKQKWDIRKTRINYNNIYYVMNDRNGCTEEMIRQFDKLTCKNKIFFSHKHHENIKSEFVIKCREPFSCVPTMTAFKNKFSIQRNYDQFDFVGWINKTTPNK